MYILWLYPLIGFIIAFGVVLFFIIKGIIRKSSFWELVMAFVISGEIVFIVFPALYEFTGPIAIGWAVGGILIFSLGKLADYLLGEALGHGIKALWLAGLCIAALLCIPVITTNIPAERARLETLDVSERVYNHLYETTEDMKKLLPISGVVAFVSGGVFITINVKNKIGMQ